MVMAAGPVTREPSSGPIVRIENHFAARVPPSMPAMRSMMSSARRKIGRVAAKVMMTTTKAGSVKSTVSPR
jgi:hypothetical protein